MSKIQAVNYQNQPKLAQKPANHAAAQSFSGNINDYEIVKATVARVNNQFTSPPGKVFKWVNEGLDKTKGEVQTQLLNALFTATLAPLVIWNNPFYKDENQKKYFALRQPVSAIIALTCGLGMTLGLNKQLDNITNDGMIESIDSRIAPTDSYLKRKSNLNKIIANPKGYISDRFLEIANDEIKADSSLKNPSGFFAKRRLKAIYFEAYKNTVKEQRKELFTALIGACKNDLRIDEKTSAIYVKRNGKWVELGRNIPNLSKQTQLDSYIAKNNIHEISFAEYLNRYYGFEVYKDGALKNQIKSTSMTKLDEIKAMQFLRDSGLAGKATVFDFTRNIEDRSINEENLNLKLSQMSDEKAAVKIKKGINPSAIVTDGEKTISQAIGKSASRAAKLGDGGVHGEKIRLSQLFEQINHMEKERTLVQMLQKPASEVFDIIGKKLNIIPSKVSNTKTLASSLEFAANVLNVKIAKLSKFKTYAAFVGIITNLVTTGVSCYALNWAYPRFVDTFFPKIAHSGESNNSKKGGNA